MKKFLVPFLAILMGIGFSAFKPTGKSSSVETPLYWYTIDDEKFGDLLTTEQLTRTDAIVQNAVPCNGNITNLCVMGHPDDDVSGQPLSSKTPDNTVYFQ